nr:hypothetical protein CFP56_46768 [Quercus suber]
MVKVGFEWSLIPPNCCDAKSRGAASPSFKLIIKGKSGGNHVTLDCTFRCYQCYGRATLLHALGTADIGSPTAHRQVLAPRMQLKIMSLALKVSSKAASA